MACGALFWPAQSALIVADLHFEKASAFARRGWLLPPHDSAETLRRLIDAIEASGARRVICLGDSFHDPGGPARLPAGPRNALRALTTTLDWLWITGNHDDSAGAALGGRVMAEARIGPLTLRHEADPADPASELSGHFHPAYGAFAGGLDVGDPAITGVMRGPVTAIVAEAGRLLHFPISAAAIAAE